MARYRNNIMRNNIIRQQPKGEKYDNKKHNEKINQTIRLRS